MSIRRQERGTMAYRGGMMEALWALLLLLVLGAVTAARMFAWGELIESGQALMLRSSALGIPIELLYFALLGLLLQKYPETPRGWYWRTFEHHHLLTPRERAWVLPLFYLGALAFLGIALGIGLVLLGALTAVQQG
jgi:hypothetical protein